MKGKTYNFLATKYYFFKFSFDVSAVIWTDTFQVFVMFAGLLTIIIKGSIQVGGIDVVWARAVEGERIDFFE